MKKNEIKLPDEFVNGTVLRFNRVKGYGFVTDDSNQEFFVHFSNIVGDGYKSLEACSAVKFKLETSPKGMKEVDLELI